MRCVNSIVAGERLWYEPIPGSAILPTLSSTSAAVLTGVESIASRCRTRQSTRQMTSGFRLYFEVWFETLRQIPIALPASRTSRHKGGRRRVRKLVPTAMCPRRGARGTLG